MFRVLVLAALLLAAFPTAAGTVKTLGIVTTWNYHETELKFERSRIPWLYDNWDRSDYEDDLNILGYHKKVLPGFNNDFVLFLRKGVSSLGFAARSEALPRYDYHFPSMDFTELATYTSCQAWQNAIEPRDDIAFVWICCRSWSRQFIVAPFFRSDKVDRNTVEGYIRQAYGDHVSPQFDKWWVDYFGYAPVKYIYMPDIPKELQSKYGVSSAVMYFDAKALEDIREAIDEAREREIKAADEEKEKARKGL